MNKKQKKILLVLIISMFLTISFSRNLRVKADSGFDTSYSSGSSGGYSSDYSGSSSWDSSSGYRGSGRSYGDLNAVDEIFLGVILFAPVILLFIFFLRKNDTQVVNNSIFVPYTDEAFTKNFPNVDINALRKEFGEIFINVQNAWMDLDEKALRKLVDNELYNSYSMNLETLRVKGQKNIMSDYDIKSLKFCGYNKQEKYTIVDTQLIISFKDYIIDSKGKVIRGKKNRTYLMKYELQFIKYDINDKCPNCGCEVDNSTGKCLSCHTEITRVNNVWLLKTKRLIKQTNIH